MSEEQNELSPDELEQISGGHFPGPSAQLRELVGKYKREHPTVPLENAFRYFDDWFDLLPPQRDIVINAWNATRV